MDENSRTSFRNKPRGIETTAMTSPKFCRVRSLGSNLFSPKTDGTESVNSIYDTNDFLQKLKSQALRKKQRNNFFHNSFVIQEQQVPPHLLRHLKNRWSINQLLVKLKAMIPLHIIRDEVNAKEEWVRRQEDEEDYEVVSKWLIHRSTSMFAFTETLILFIYVWLCWLVSLKFVFGDEYIMNLGSFPVYAALGCCLLDGLLKVNTERIDHNKSIKNRRLILFKYIKIELWVDLVAISLVLMVLSAGQHSSFSSYYLALPCLLIMSYKTNYKYRNVEIYLENIIGNGSLKLLGSFFMLISIGHFTALALYSSISLNQEVNWLNKMQFGQRSWHADYIYSLYWAFTIITTVGFGDIAPTNKYEMMIVIVIEIMGSSLFGYMISVIGMTLTQMKQKIQFYQLYFILLILRKSKEQLENNIKIADKLINCLGLDQSLSYRLKSFLKDNQKVDQSFSVAEESHILSRLSPALKYQIMKVTNFRVVSKCTFLLTYFNRRFLNQVSVRLTKRVLQPGEQLLQDPSDWDMFIVDSGRIDIEYRMAHKSTLLYRKVGTISKLNEHEIGSNLYGYVAAITNRATRLNAVSRCFTLVYRLGRRDFLQIVGNGASNYEVMCQLRHRFESVRVLESIQGPLLTDPTCHFIPNVHILVKKQRRQNKKQKRKAWLRRVHCDLNPISLLSAQEIDIKENGPSKRNSAEHNMSVERKSKVFKNMYSFSTTGQYIGVEDFDRVRIFENYFKNGNYNIVLERFQKISTMKTYACETENCARLL